MNILAIESSCDETAAAILKDGELLSNVVVSQIDIFKAYGGVIPEVAARSHLEAILPVIDQAMSDAHVTWDDITHLAVTHTPGLLGSLLIGTLTARTLAILHNKPLYAVHHLKSHIYSNWLKDESSRRGESFPCTKVEPGCTFRDNKEPRPTVKKTLIPFSSTCLHRAEKTGYRSFFDDRDEAPIEKSTSGSTYSTKKSITPVFPLLALVISGGHTQIIYMKKHNDFQIIGTTLDDAVGECFDKIAKILGLPYPGGPSIANAAENGNPKKYKFPHPQTPNSLDFSFSGLKTAVLRTVQKECGVPLSYPSHDLKNLLSEQQIADFAASFQQTAIDILLEKLELALTQHPETKSIVFAGGVSANKQLRKNAMENFCSVTCPNLQTPAVQTTTFTKRVRGDVVDERRTKCCGLDDCGSKPRTRTELKLSPAVYFPAPHFSGDNAAMVAEAAYWEIKSGIKPTDPYKLTLAPRSLLC